MRYVFAAISLAAVSVTAQGVTAVNQPSTPSPAGCSPNFDGSFGLTVANATTPSKNRKRDPCSSSGAFVVTLKNGVLTDSEGGIGTIESNHQFQFDSPPQAGALFTGGWSVCANGTLALGGSTIFYQCISGDFFNIYDTAIAPQCGQIFIELVEVECAATTSVTGAPSVSGAQPSQATQIAGSQVQNPGGVSEISEGQIQSPGAATQAPQQTGGPVSEISEGQIQNGGAVSQITDCLIQNPGAASEAPKPSGGPVSELSEGQIQNPGAATQPASQTGSYVVQIKDGQIQKGESVSQISEGQIQAVPSASQAPVAEISEGQLQVTEAPAATPAPAVSELREGQIQNEAPEETRWPGCCGRGGGRGGGVHAGLRGTVLSPPRP